MHQQAVDTGDAGGQWLARRFGTVDELTMTVRKARPGVAWSAAQLSAGQLAGQVSTCRGRRTRMTCSRVHGDYQLRGPVSTSNVVLALALGLGEGARQWLQPVASGAFGLYQPNESADCLFRGDAFYLTVDLTHAQLESEAELAGRVLDGCLMHSGVSPYGLPAGDLAALSQLLGQALRAETPTLPPGQSVEDVILSTLVGQLGRVPRPLHGMPQGGYGRIVARARAYVEAHLENPILIDEIAAAAFASRRSLHRAFDEILGETPQGYVLKLRLNRIRQDLANEAEVQRTVTTVSHKWGIPELGRMAARYREQFGELPSATAARTAH